MTKHRVLVVAQARVGSSRLPRKSLLKIGKYVFFELVLRRIKQARYADGIVVALPETAENDELVDIAKDLGVDIVRGPEGDVLRRFVIATREASPNIIIRVCCDNPLVSPEALDALVLAYDERKHDLVQNVSRSSGYPDGVGAEIFSDGCLIRLDSLAAEQQCREHVTRYAYIHPDQFKIGELIAPAAWFAPHLRFDIDYFEDYLAMSEFIDLLGVDPSQAKLEEIVAAGLANPGILEKRHRRDDIM